MCRLLHIGSLEAVCLVPAAVGGRFARSKLSAAQRAGLAFQRKLSKALPFESALVRAGTWLAFRDRNGAGLAQPDAFVQPLPDGSVLLVEAKLKLSAAAVDEARRQVGGLYLPLLAVLYPEAEQRAVIVGRHLGGERAVPLAELGWRDLGPKPMLAFWDTKRPLGALAC